MQKDSYGTVINGHETFYDVAQTLDTYHAILFPWSDEEGTQFDILLNILPAVSQSTSGDLIQGGVRRSDLFISIMRLGSFGFDIGNTDTHWAYYAEKLAIPKGGGTGKKLADLFNGIKAELLRIRTRTR